MKRVALWVIVALAIFYAIQGGEYSTIDLFRQRSREEMLKRAVDSLKHDVDSLTQWRRRILTDPATQERIAREDFGMVRGDRELLYRFIEGDSARKPRR